VFRFCFSASFSALSRESSAWMSSSAMLSFVPVRLEG
jgi:hypothetical protein